MSIIPERIKKWARLAADKKFRQQYQEYKRLSKLPRFKEAEATLNGKKIKIADAHSFLYSRNELFNLEIYKFKSTREDPFIIDCGSNIGLSIIYFKQLYPLAKVIGFEPDDKIFRTLEYNVTLFNLSGVELFNKACWNTDTVLKFFSEGADGGRKATSFDESDKIGTVEAVRLKNFLDRDIDFLKIDIEGAEYIVLNDIQDKLHLVKNIFVEFHSVAGEEQMLAELLGLLKKAGFRLYISSTGNVARQPFIDRPQYLRMDNQINIYGYKNEHFNT